MELAAIILEYVRTLVWPVLLIAFVIGFRPRIHQLFDRMTKVDVFGANVEFAQTIGAAKEAIAAAHDSEVARAGHEIRAPSTSHPAKEQGSAIATAAQRALDGIPAWRWRTSRSGGRTDSLDMDTVRQAYQCLLDAQDSVESAFGTLTRGSVIHMAERTGISEWTGVIRALDGADRAGALARHLAGQSGSETLSPYQRELAHDYVKVVDGALDLLVEALQKTVIAHRTDNHRD